MTERNNNYQVLLSPEQYETLEQMASWQKRPIAELVEEMVRLGLKSLRERQHQEALDRLTQRREEIYRTHGMYPGDIVAEVRAEREKQIDRVLRGEP